MASTVTSIVTQIVTTTVLATATGTDAAASGSSTGAASAADKPAAYKVVGIVLAVGSGLFIGASFVFKKKGLISAQKKAGGAAGEGHPYLKSPLWWTGMVMMIVGEILNFVAYAFASAILVTPLGALSVVICAILSSFFLKEKLTFFGKIGCLLCILGATILALNGPQEQSTSTIREFMHLFIAPGFLVWTGLCIIASLVLVFYAAPKCGKQYMLVYITVCSLIGGLSVACTTGLGAAILTSIRGENQVTFWFFWFLTAFVVCTLLIEINYLNKALELFNTAMVTPTYYVIFTGCTLVTSSILYKGFKASALDIVTVVLAFVVICCGITLLQLSKVDPEEIQQGLDRKSTILLSAARSQVRRDVGDDEKAEYEDPGIDTIRGTFGAIGSVKRAISGRSRSRRDSTFDPSEVRRRNMRRGDQTEMEEGGIRIVTAGNHDLVRHQLYDAPMPLDAADKVSLHSAGLASPNLPFGEGGRPRSSTIQFSPSNLVHGYPAIGETGTATHEHTVNRSAQDTPSPLIPPSSMPMSALPPSADVTSFPPVIGGPAFLGEGDRHNTLPSPKSASGQTLSDLMQHYSTSTPDLHRGQYSPTPQFDDSESTVHPPRSKFPHLPLFDRSSSSSNETHHSGHKVKRPKGPRELDEQESESLVPTGAHDSAANSDEDDDEDDKGNDAVGDAPVRAA